MKVRFYWNSDTEINPESKPLPLKMNVYKLELTKTLVKRGLLS
jgi:hypothetical protein